MADDKADDMVASLVVGMLPPLPREPPALGLMKHPSIVKLTRACQITIVLVKSFVHEKVSKLSTLVVAKWSIHICLLSVVGVV